MIMGIDRPTAGEVNVTGCPVHSMSENELAKWRGQHVGSIFQFFQMLPSLSLLQNVTLPMEFAGKYGRAERRQRALYLLELIGLADQANKLPAMVSGGQQQRAAIARSLATDPPLLVAEEPTGNLDAKTAGQVFDIFMRLIEEQGKTMLMVAHDSHLADLIPRQIEIVNGRITNDKIFAAGWCCRQVRVLHHSSKVQSRTPVLPFSPNRRKRNFTVRICRKGAGCFLMIQIRPLSASA